MTALLYTAVFAAGATIGFAVAAIGVIHGIRDAGRDAPRDIRAFPNLKGTTK